MIQMARDWAEDASILCNSDPALVHVARLARLHYDADELNRMLTTIH